MDGPYDSKVGCGHCRLQGSCAMTSQNSGRQDPNAHLEGVVSGALIVFLMPLALGIAGAWAAAQLGAQESSTSLNRCHILGLAAGLATGVLLAKLIVLLRRPRKACPPGGEECSPDCWTE